MLLLPERPLAQRFARGLTKVVAAVVPERSLAQRFARGLTKGVDVLLLPLLFYIALALATVLGLTHYAAWPTQPKDFQRLELLKYSNNFCKNLLVYLHTSCLF